MRKRYPDGRLMVSSGKVDAGLYVYGVVHWIEATDSCDVQWIGWAWGWQVKKMKTQAITTKRGDRMQSHRGIAPNAMDDLWYMTDSPPYIFPRPEVVTEMDMDGRLVVTRRAPDGKSFEVTKGGNVICLAYKAGDVWYDALDPKNTAYSSGVKARVAAVKRMTATVNVAKPRPGSTHFFDKE